METKIATSVQTSSSVENKEADVSMTETSSQNKTADAKSSKKQKESPRNKVKKEKKKVSKKSSTITEKFKETKRKMNRFGGMSEEEVLKRTLPDHIIPNLDILIIGINPGLYAAYKGHHYAGPGNHFWQCMYMSGLTPDLMTADDDFRLVNFGIGFTNLVERTTRGSADIPLKEMKEAKGPLLEKLKKYSPKIAVFNGKVIYEVFSGKKKFNFGKQQDLIEGTNCIAWVMPSSSARCAQLPRAIDKVPYYVGLRKLRDFMLGFINEIHDVEIIFESLKNMRAKKEEETEETSPYFNNTSPYFNSIDIPPIKQE